VSPAPTRSTDVEQVLLEEYADLGHTVTRTGTDLQALIAEHGAVIRFHRTGGRDEGWQVIHRVATEVYAATYDAAWNTAEELARRLLMDPPGYPIDRVANDSANAEIGYADQNIRLVVATWRITVRRNT